MADLLPLRGYQRECIDAIEADWRAGITRPAVVLPTGAGKTVVFSHLAARWRQSHESRVMILAHRDELIGQAQQKLHAVAPHLTSGIVKGSRHEVSRDVIVASVQSLRSATRRARLHHIGLIVTDEAHHATAETYRAVYQDLGALDTTGVNGHEGTHMLGVTATLVRGDDASLGDIWQKVSYRKDILWMIRRGYLLDVTGRRVEIDMDMDKIRKSRGDYADGALGDALSMSFAPEIVAKAVVEHGTGRSGVLFAPTVASAQEFCDALLDAGVTAEVVSGQTPAAERAAIFARCHDGTTQILCNCGVATEGTDVPRWSLAIIARPTQLPGLYMQMVGRVLRPYPGQGPGQPIEKALVLDVVGVTRRHQLASLADLGGKTYRRPVELDESLLERDDAEDAWLSERNEDQGLGLERDYVSGPTRVVEIDLFASSRQQWHQTDGGAWFLPAGPNYWVFLAPAEPGTFAVCWAHKYQRRGGYTEHVNIALDTAMAWGETVAAEQPGFEHIADKKAQWRKRPATDKAIRYARSRGCVWEGMDDPFADKPTGADIDALLSVREASPKLDAIIAKINAKRAALGRK